MVPSDLRDTSADLMHGIKVVAGVFNRNNKAAFPEQVYCRSIAGTRPPRLSRTIAFFSPSPSRCWSQRSWEYIAVVVVLKPNLYYSLFLPVIHRY